MTKRPEVFSEVGKHLLAALSLDSQDGPGGTDATRCLFRRKKAGPGEEQNMQGLGGRGGLEQ